MTWLLNEDAAVKAKFAGLKVTDANAPVGGRPVSVRFSDPEMELAKLSYPIVLISRQQMEHMPEREHRGAAPVLYWPEGNGYVDDSRWNATTAPRVDFPVPMDIPYQITVMSRRANHQTQLAAAMAQTEYLPARFGYLEVPQDASIRSLFVDGGPEYSITKDADGKRLLLTHYNIRIPTEIPPVIDTTAPVATVDLTVGPL